MINRSPNPLIIVKHESLLINAFSEALEFEESKKGYKPNRILNYANIYIDEEYNDWKFLNSTFHNYQPYKKDISSINSEKEVFFKMHELEALLLTLDKHPPIKPTYPPLDWSYCFLAQLSMAAEMRGISPEELFEIFCIQLQAPFENTWKSFNWREGLELDYYPLSVKSEGHNARLQ